MSETHPVSEDICVFERQSLGLFPLFMQNSVNMLLHFLAVWALHSGLGTVLER